MKLILTIFIYFCLLGTIYSRRQRRADNNQEVEIEDVAVKNNQDLEKKLNNMNSGAKNKQGFDETLSDDERKSLQKEELSLRRGVAKAALDHGDISEQKATALHKLGRVVYKLEKYEDALDISKGIVKIFEGLYGNEHLKTADALGNLGSVTFRLKRKELCAFAMNRALYIIIKTHGITSKEVLMHRARMLTFQIPDAKTSEGLRYEEALDEYGNLIKEEL